MSPHEAGGAPDTGDETSGKQGVPSFDAKPGQAQKKKKKSKKKK